MIVPVASEIFSFLDDIPFGWDWTTFWPELVAGLITFFVGVPYALWLLWIQHKLDSGREFKRFQKLAREILSEFEDLDDALAEWGKSRSAGQRIVPFSAPPTSWEIDDSVRSIFAGHGVQLVTHSAVNWYREAANSARDWNATLSEESSRLLASRIPSARERLKPQSKRFEKRLSLLRRRAETELPLNLPRLSPSTYTHRCNL